MRDTYQNSDLDAGLDAGQHLKSLILGHSIRPRSTVLARAKQRGLTHDAALVDKQMLSVDLRTPRWQDLSLALPGPKSRSASTMQKSLAKADRDPTTRRAFDQLRTRLRQTTLKHGWTNIGVMAPTSGCGTTFTAVNLALSLARVPGSRTLLMDMNMRSPALGDAFDVAVDGPIADFLSGQTPIGAHLVRPSETLALGLNDEVEDNPAEILQDAATATTLERMRAAIRPEMVLYDLPGMLTFDDATAFLPQLDAVLLVSDGSQTMGRELKECERLMDGKTPLLGVVLNRARANSITRYS